MQFDCDVPVFIRQVSLVHEVLHPFCESLVFFCHVVDAIQGLRQPREVVVASYRRDAGSRRDPEDQCVLAYF